MAFKGSLRDRIQLQKSVTQNQTNEIKHTQP